MEEIPSLNLPIQRLNVAILPLDVPCSGPVTHSGKILTTGKSHGKKPDINTRLISKVCPTVRPSKLVRMVTPALVYYRQIKLMHPFTTWRLCLRSDKTDKQSTNHGDITSHIRSFLRAPQPIFNMFIELKFDFRPH